MPGEERRLRKWWVSIEAWDKREGPHLSEMLDKERQMRKLLLIIMLVGVGLGVNATGSRPALMELPLFERAVLIIKHYETLHHPEHWPTIGYGHVVQPGEPYRKGVQLTESQADALLRKDLRKFCAMYRSYGADSLILSVLAYNCGPRTVKESGIPQKLKTGDRNILDSYTSHCHYKGKWHQGLYRRRIVELVVLFEP